jgi:GNAT superfamily N-acetyltransferase
MTSPTLGITQLQDPVPAEVAGFVCGEDDAERDIQDFLRQDAIGYVAKGVAQVYLGWSDGGLVGFFTLSCGALRFEEMSREVRREAHLDDIKVVPGVPLGRLAVDIRFRKQGMGTALFQEALRIAKYEVASQSGCRLLFLDARYEKLTWYEKCGCRILGTVATPPSTTKMGFDLLPPSLPS